MSTAPAPDRLEAGPPGTARRTVVARNIAATSNNRVHSDEFAQEMGYRGALVPGSTVLSYLEPVIAEAFGGRWHESGAAFVQFKGAVYDGEELQIAGEPDPDLPGALRVAVAPDGADRPPVVASAWIASDATAPDVRAYPLTAPPADPVPLTEAYALDTQAMGSCPAPTDRATIDAYLAQISDQPLAADAKVPSSYLAKMYAELMRTNVTRGPSIHVSTLVQQHRAVELGEELTVRGRIDRIYGRKAGRYYVLDMAWVDADERVVVTAEHTGIYHIRKW
ncbi:MAG: hypothetical protein AVDCRST_MAG50-1855 [uncultured Acidimicrobiales bacterium]|uniref:MaoC-like domain-containing protein n=1 Tax=uncultured Acidimicrobiales bacterium TaxID=310071 RepID=A0A6J4I7Q7_9ACTN|nr:MAG: hypothetical protein AVDCRST_MAG50-1855 [uncultured Acidimicrobiales bacterium]